MSRRLEPNTRTMNLANATATFPRVDTSFHKLLLNDRPELTAKRRNTPPGFFAKLVGFFNPMAWSTAYMVAALFTLAIIGLTNFGIRIEAREIHSPLVNLGKISNEIGIGLFLCALFTLFVFHFLLNYRRHDRGGVTKAYWYSFWAYSLSFYFLPWVHLPLSAHRANQINEFCFVNKTPSRCEKTLLRVHRERRQKAVVRLFPESKRLWVADQLKRLEPVPVVVLPNGGSRSGAKRVRTAPRITKGSRRFAKTISPSRRLAYQE